MSEPKLTIELVPEGSFYNNLRSKVSKARWDKIRTNSYKKANYKCDICGGKGNKWPVECHEIWEYNDEKLIQTLVGVTALCPSCHEVKHIGLANVRGRLDIASNHLMKINNWDYEETTAYIESAFDKWRERSKHEWNVDVGWLVKNNY